MLKEYYVVARYIASVPSSKDYTEFILNEVEKEFSSVKAGDLRPFIDNLFSVIEGEEIEPGHEEYE